MAAGALLVVSTLFISVIPRFLSAPEGTAGFSGIIPQFPGRAYFFSGKTLAFSRAPWYNDEALMCVYSNKEVDSHG